ncbi:DUF397 domain-containing protein [Nocardiopsis sp. CA-288880]|uniref:DUF397 domain-containing protein n=1 Tax=Nocardiopsis sp. CA-288880 TaxID=3239995 RepID=UPI003D9A0763
MKSLVETVLLVENPSIRGFTTLSAQLPQVRGRSDACPTVPVRDGKNPAGPIVAVGADAWTAFAGPPGGVEPGHGASNLVTVSALSHRAAARSSWRIMNFV